jgi:ankyrin repeat protein
MDAKVFLQNGKIKRRGFMSMGLGGLSLASVVGQPAYAQSDRSSVPVRPEPKRGPRQDPDLVKSFVVAAHNDSNLDRIKELLARDPKLVLSAHDWGDGDWETGLGGASHIGSRKMAQYLLSQGARIDSFCAAMLAQREVVAALIAANPSVATTKGPHGYTLLYHAAVGGDVEIAELIKPHLGPHPAAYTQALSAAVRDGHLEMTRWLFENGEVDPNLPDALGKRPLATATAKGYREVVEELRKRGAKE